MESNKKLNELGAEYLCEAKKIDRMIEEKKRVLPTLRGNAAIDCERRLRILREMKRDCEDTGIRLVNYYREQRPRIIQRRKGYIGGKKQ